jgi:hypothetical protein
VSTNTITRSVLSALPSSAQLRTSRHGRSFSPITIRKTCGILHLTRPLTCANFLTVHGISEYLRSGIRHNRGGQRPETGILVPCCAPTAFLAPGGLRTLKTRGHTILPRPEKGRVHGGTIAETRYRRARIARCHVPGHGTRIRGGGAPPPARQTRLVTWPASGRPAMSPVTC